MSVLYVRGEDGSFYPIKTIKGDKGDKGDPGKDGTTPHIGENGNWFVDEVDTGIKAGGPVVLTEDTKPEIVDAVLAALPTWEGGSY